MTKDEQDKLTLEVAREVKGTLTFGDADDAIELCSRFLERVDAERGKENGEAVCWVLNDDIEYDGTTHSLTTINVMPANPDNWSPLYLSPTIQPAREAELLAIIQKKDEALHAISLCEINSMSSRMEMGRLSREALALKPEKKTMTDTIEQLQAENAAGRRMFDKEVARNVELAAQNQAMRKAMFAILCDPEGTPCFRGSDGDRAVIAEVIALPDPATDIRQLAADELIEDKIAASHAAVKGDFLG